MRANLGVFRNPSELQKLVKEEGLAGWILLEKLDNTRVRFKRPLSARQNDYQLPQGIDPYRSHYGMNPTLVVLLLTALIVGLSLGFGLILFLVIGLFAVAGP